MTVIAKSSMRPQIALVVPSLEQGGGVPTVADFYYRTIENAGAFDIKLISLATSARDELGIGLTKPSTWLQGVRTREGLWAGRPFTKVGASFSEFEVRRHYPRRALTDLLRGCDLIQVVAGSPACAWSVCGLGTPVSVQCATRVKVERQRRDASPAGVLGRWRKHMTRFTDRMDDRALGSVDAIQVSNQWMYEYAHAVNRGREVDIRLVPNGVNVTKYSPVENRDLERARYVLCVGRFADPRKNLNLLIDAFAAIPADIRASVRLVLAGSTPPPDEFWSRAQDRGLRSQVEYVPSPTLDELIRLYQAATVFALSSAEEGFGMVLIEAMACGIPVVATACGGPDGIVVDQQDGFLVPVDDTNAFADRLTHLLANPSENRRMGQAAREAVLAKFEFTAAGAVLLDVYERLLARRSGKHAISANAGLPCVE
jgi:glycosyltransferase involved in cell wall biosynthesis